MTIKGEIEKLEAYRHRVLTYEYETINKADVFSILDKHLGECVAQWIANDELSNVPQGIRESFRPGDHISIYVRREK